MKRFLFVLILISSVAQGRPIEVRVRDYGWLTSIPVARSALDSYLNSIEDDVNEEQPIISPKRVNYGTANSSVLASKGLGVDYVNTPEKYEISLGIGGAWDEERNVAIKDEISGAAAASGLSVGVPMKHVLNKDFFGLDRTRMMGFISFGFFRAGQSFPGQDVNIAGKIDSTNASAHLRYDLIQEKGWGVKVLTGYELNMNRVELSTSVNEPISVDTGGSGILEGRLTGKPVFDVETVTHSFPVEVSGDVRFLSVFTFFSGLGTDLNFGLSKGKGSTKGDFSTLACTSGACVGETLLPQLEVQANYDAQSQVRNVTFRGFGGFQLDLPGGMHGFVQGSQMLGTKVIGLNLGLRFTY